MPKIPTRNKKNAQEKINTLSREGRDGFSMNPPTLLIKLKEVK